MRSLFIRSVLTLSCIVVPNYVCVCVCEQVYVRHACTHLSIEITSTMSGVHTSCLSTAGKGMP